MSGVNMLLTDSQVGLCRKSAAADCAIGLLPDLRLGPIVPCTIWVPAFGTGGDGEVRDLMERIYSNYCTKLGQKASFRRKLQRKGKEVVEYVPGNL